MNKLIQNLMVVIAIIALTTACQYKFIVEPTIPPPDPGDTTLPKVSFSGKVEPIFTNLGCTACHKAGQQKPNLETGAAYSSIMTLNLADTTDPESSIIYQKPLPSGSHFVKYKSSDANTVLLWIQQGALNN